MLVELGVWIRREVFAMVMVGLFIWGIESGVLWGVGWMGIEIYTGSLLSFGNTSEYWEQS